LLSSSNICKMSTKSFLSMVCKRYCHCWFNKKYGLSAGYLIAITIPLKNASFCPISVSVSNFNPQNTRCIPVVKIFALTRGIHAPRPYGQLNRCPILLSCRIALELKQKWAFFKGLLTDPTGMEYCFLVLQLKQKYIDTCRIVCNYMRMPLVRSLVVNFVLFMEKPFSSRHKDPETLRKNKK
jgi:hypothetical protein